MSTALMNQQEALNEGVILLIGACCIPLAYSLKFQNLVIHACCKLFIGLYIFTVLANLCFVLYDAYKKKVLQNKFKKK